MQQAKNPVGGAAGRLKGQASKQPEKASLGSDLNGINFSVSHCVAVMNHAMTSCR